jgi:RNA polymerase sigma-70 factor (ECF subfamily)
MKPGARPPQSGNLKSVLETIVGALYEQSAAAEFGLDISAFAAILEEVGARQLAANASQAEAREFLSRLKLRELALARACAAGHDAAWNRFWVEYREKLYDFARHVAREESAARDLADSIYADLYGLSTRGGERACKLASYTGRRSLDGWLRTVLAQEYVNRYRTRKRLVSLEEQEEAGVQYVAASSPEVVAADPRLARATDQALAELDPEDRFVLASYFLDERTLAEIARVLGKHESSISRRLDKIAAGLEKKVRDALLGQGLDARQVEEILQVDVRDLPVNVRASLAQDSGKGSFLEQGKTTGGEKPVR